MTIYIIEYIYMVEGSERNYRLYIRKQPWDAWGGSKF